MSRRRPPSDSFQPPWESDDEAESVDPAARAPLDDDELEALQDREERGPRRDHRDHRLDFDGDLAGGFRSRGKDRRRSRWRRR